jgi:hypothetical protein
VTKSQTPEPTKTEQTVATASRKREFTAVAAATTVTIALGIVSQVLIGKASQKVADKINPPKPQAESTN